MKKNFCVIGITILLLGIGILLTYCGNVCTSSEGWSNIEVVSTESSLDSGGAELVVDSSDTLHVVWSDETNYGGSGSDRDIFYKRLIYSDINGGEVVSSYDGILSSSADLQLTDGVYISATYTVDAKMDISEKGCYPDGNANCDITLQNGKITLYVSVDILGIDQDGEAQQSIPIGQTLEIPIPNTMGLIKTKVRTIVTIGSIEGSDIISFDSSSIQFASEGKKNLGFTVSDNANIGDYFSISATASVDIEVEVIADTVVMGEQSLAKESLPITAMSPVLQVTGQITNPSSNGFFIDFEDPITLFVLFFVIIIIIVIIATAVKKKKSEKKKVDKKQDKTQENKASKKGPKLVEKKDEQETKEKSGNIKEKKATEEKLSGEKKHPKFCPECSHKLEGTPKFCPECGNKLI